jgi:hypothetical protein
VSRSLFAATGTTKWGATLIQNVSQGTSFTSIVDNKSKVVTYTFDLGYCNTFGTYVRHVGSRVPGLTLSKTVEWATPRYDGAGSALSETLTYSLRNCGLIARGTQNTHLQVRTCDGTWQTIEIPLLGNLAQEWQAMMFSNICPVMSK